MGAKLCVVCGQGLSEFRRSNRRYCSGLCRVRAFRIRAGIGTRGKHLHREHSRTAAKVIGGAAAALAFAALKEKLDQERAARQTQENLVAKLRDQLARTEQARADATREAQQLHDAAQTRHQQLQQERMQNQGHQATIQQLWEDLSQSQRELRDAKWEFKELHAEWNGAENQCADMRRQLEAYGATQRSPLSLPRAGVSRQQGQLEKAHKRNRELAQQIRQLKGQLAPAQRQHAELVALSNREAALVAQVDILQRRLEGAEGQAVRLARKVKFLKKGGAELPDQGPAEEPSNTLLSGLAKVLGVFGAGVAMSHLTADQHQLKPPRKRKRLPAPSAEFNSDSATRALPAKPKR